MRLFLIIKYNNGIIRMLGFFSTIYNMLMIVNVTFTTLTFVPRLCFIREKRYEGRRGNPGSEHADVSHLLFKCQTSRLKRTLTLQ